MCGAGQQYLTDNMSLPSSSPFLAFAMHAGSGSKQNWCWSGLDDIFISKFLETERELEFSGQSVQQMLVANVNLKEEDLQSEKILD